MRKINYIVVHHSNTDYGDINNLYLQQKDNDVSLTYNYVISNGYNNVNDLKGRKRIDDGKIMMWMPDELVSNHTEFDDFNNTSLSICLIGNFFSYKPTADQILSLKELVINKAIEYSVSVNKILCHYEVYSLHMKPIKTVCPGPLFAWKEIRSYLNSKVHI